MRRNPEEDRVTVMELAFACGALVGVTEPEDGQPVSLLRGLGVHRFAVRLAVDVRRPADGCSHLLLGGEAWAVHPTGGPQWIGPFTPVVVPLPAPGAAEVTELSMPVTNDQVLAMERAHGREDLRLRIDLRGTLPQSAAHPCADGRGVLRVPAGGWDTQLRALTAMLAAPAAL